MITKRDCILLLSQLEDANIDIREMMQKAIANPALDLDVIKFINSHRQFDVAAFYEKLRRSYNSKKSILYKTIVTCDEVDMQHEALAALASLNLQIILYMKTAEDATMFLKHIHFTEITEALNNYSKTFDLVPCIQVLQLIKSDLKVFEYIK